MRRGRLRPAAAALAVLLLPLAGCDRTAAPAARAAAAGEPAQGGDRGRHLPPVVDHVRTTDRVVFLTYDDSAERDPAFTVLIRERRLPVTLFLTDTVAGPAYGDFARLRSVGASLQNHTLDHRALSGLPYAGQRAEICGQQTKLTSRFGVRAHLFRPPHGAYDTTTLRAAADCGITALVLWRAALNADGALTYTRGDHRLHPGDVIAVDPDHPTATDLTSRTEHLLKTVAEQGLRVGNLEDYL
ncbi:polysaccharide deacetylase family protein [Streptomyces olivaceus]|uniref:polysaccharide deacetylase family protein n=1 Tax=Streptomyces olivaceus TaxID=47716 RepID=UPI001CC983F3|nr:polysaccharide deacetylase family protein [Streptomyces olivaceus]MBZ6289617.1 polysaccharide deacetylase family protein [Streptomyces olivaceus]MBZ6326636.1 polysaccharide deacetylase family protein [Streptomyces olivaceus]